MTVPSSDIHQTLVTYIVDNFDTDYTVNSFPVAKSLLELGFFDSYTLVELILFIEENWDISISDSETTEENLASIENILSFVERKLG